MSEPLVRGWCPGAYRPMMSGDGLVVRVRPRLARLTREQVLGLCDAATRHGNGIVELTNRANLQLRGVTEAAHAPLLEALAALDLLDADPALEVRRNILTPPFAEPGDLTARLAEALVARLADLPPLPAKFGFAIDTGSARLLADASADIRLERGAAGGLILRADGAETGRPVDEEHAIDAVIETARWFADHHGPDTRRMARLVAARGLPGGWTGAASAPLGARPEPGDTAIGPLVGVPFGQVRADALRALIQASGARALRVTPWRLVLAEGGQMPDLPDFVTRPGDRRLAVDACPGAPLCPQAQGETRALALELAARVTGSLHVSGCAKGCARRLPADLTLTARDGRFDLIRNGRAGDAPDRRGLTHDDLLKLAEPC
ncbi:cobalamin biosynthesis protein CobG [Jhaorihella thermophila]|uniref:Precorrin-3B synthase n=1 Tax=Jhaorihella thermophila TaxID=488547 RepID=A0A1H5YSY4_9RHOB|nr:cobalamin biosynthesis protein CobG [Jhaorihella thermophila]SEG27293.1 precorrin-3B synthase [Jhaorihella thermophila]